jgi:hypothetical protein
VAQELTRIAAFLKYQRGSHDWLAYVTSPEAFPERSLGMVYASTDTSQHAWYLLREQLQGLGYDPFPGDRMTADLVSTFTATAL